MSKTLGKVSNMLVAYHDPTAAASEAFRVLRTNLQFQGLDKPLKSILVTSATPSEGKSTVSSNLAVAFAQSGARTCLVDADLRRPRTAKVFGMENWTGLTTALISQEKDLDLYLQETETPGLSLLTSGPIPPNPAELLGTNRMHDLLLALEQRFDMVIIDSPPVLAVTDAAVLAPKVGGVLLVVRANEVARAQVRRAKEALDAVKAKILGSVLGGVKSGQSDGYYYYDYYGSSERSDRKSL